MASEHHVPTPVADVFIAQVKCSCGWESDRCASIVEAWRKYREHWSRAVETTEPVSPPPRRPPHSPLQVERLFEP